MLTDLEERMSLFEPSQVAVMGGDGGDISTGEQISTLERFPSSKRPSVRLFSLGLYHSPPLPYPCGFFPYKVEFPQLLHHYLWTATGENNLSSRLCTLLFPSFRSPVGCMESIVKVILTETNLNAKFFSSMTLQYTVYLLYNVKLKQNKKKNACLFNKARVSIHLKT